MKKLKFWGPWLGLSLVFGMAGAWLMQQWQAGAPTRAVQFVEGGAQGRFANLGSAPQNFAQAAEDASPSVVFIKTLSQYGGGGDDYWSYWDFFGYQRRGQVSSAGSGVIMTADGYIVTNNHVVERADQVEVVLPNKHSYPAKIIGTDPSTDLAVLKIEAKGLKPITLGNSDQVRTGDWVLALGNPLNLKSTVTAGIVSAKGRNINIVKSQFPIESFIQTDAAINPGNSGGALVDVQGQLVGINTAIATKTGAYQGYGFAIPVNIVRKVIGDLIDHGTVQRAFLGAEVLDIDASLADKLVDEDYGGVYVFRVDAGSAAEAAGLRADDIILELDGVAVDSKAAFEEQLAYRNPGDKLVLHIKRKGSTQPLAAQLTNSEGTTGVIKNRTAYSELLGCDLSPLSKVERSRLGVDQGWRVSNLRSGVVSRMGLPEGFVILSINREVPETAQQLEDLIKGTRGRLILEGINPNGSRGTYSFYSY
ncbi:MAG: trypsin-like peptidase domain-containing protein [Bacteroidetes bacterium]|jgi:serine protease Do|nr:trypsin-like peptidase domain-containing protein [Bacteroidota bacterium]